MNTPILRRPGPGLRALMTALSALAALWVLRGPLALAQPAPAPRRGETVAVLQLPFQGVTREVEASLREALREALGQSGFDTLPDSDVASKLQRDPQLAACTSRSCFARAALTLGVRRVIEGEIEKPQRSTYRVRLSLRDLRTGQFVSTPEEERCDICGTEEARQMLVRVALRLCRAVPPPDPNQRTSETGTLQVDSQPLGSEVLIDGVHQEDRTPAMFLLPVGVHSLELRAPSHKAVRRSIEIGAGKHVALNLELVAVAPRRPWLTALSGVLLGGAVGLGITSGVLFRFHNQPAYNQPPEDPCLPPQATCPYKYDNLVGGSVTAALAGALLIGGAIALYYDNAAPRRRLVVMPAAPAKQ